MRKIAAIVTGVCLGLGLIGMAGCGGEDPAKKPGFHAETAADPGAVMKQMRDTKGNPVVPEGAKPAAEKPTK